MTQLKALPIGIQESEKVRRGDYLYIDKTELIYNMIKGGTYYFLSRPRLFDKSLLMSTIHAIFAARRNNDHILLTMQNLIIYTKYNQRIRP